MLNGQVLPQKWVVYGLVHKYSHYRLGKHEHQDMGGETKCFIHNMIKHMTPGTHSATEMGLTEWLTRYIKWLHFHFFIISNNI